MMKNCLFLVPEAFMSLFVRGDEVAPLVNRAMKRCFLNLTTIQNKYSSVTAILSFGWDLIYIYI